MDQQEEFSAELTLEGRLSDIFKVLNRKSTNGILLPNDTISKSNIAIRPHNKFNGSKKPIANFHVEICQQKIR